MKMVQKILNYNILVKIEKLLNIKLFKKIQ